MFYKVSIKNFDGPFDLLVFLVEKNEMDIYDINISEIIEDYLLFIEKAKKLQYIISPEFLVLAATLMEIKSFMLIPQNKELENTAEDPRTKLKAKLSLYIKFKELAKAIKEKELSAKEVKRKSKEDYFEIFGEQDEILSLPMNKFISSFLLFLEKKKNILAMRKQFERREREQENIASKITFINALFEKKKKKRISFYETLKDKTNKREKVLSFFSLLEMSKENLVSIFQNGSFKEIFIERKGIKNG
ncbi:MAG: segregation/condensation protein A [Clostridiales Family XIII bacterium]|jgi:segregation and condensation protein A|nr:segregation/condensation protein A [Clostridiales Family XIII bacterium]